MNQNENTKRLPSLDGWRALSIIFVLGYHSRVVTGFPKTMVSIFNWLFDGDLGVRIFFVISGFIITYLLLQEFNRNGSINLRNFYIRRALRILPVYYVYILVVFLLQKFTPWHQSLSAWIANLTFTTNFFGSSWTTGHLWSIAVEEQFYLLWPCLLVWGVLKKKNRNDYYILGVPLVVAPLARVISYICNHGVNHASMNFRVFNSIIFFIKNASVISPFFQVYSFINYFDSLAVGCIAAILFTKKRCQIDVVFNQFKTIVFCVGLSLILIPHFLVNFSLIGFITLPFGATLQAIGFSILLLQSVSSPQLYKPLNWPFIKTLGVLSYSVYIWQMIFCSNPNDFGISNHWFITFPGWILASYLIAFCSYYGLEKPFMQLREYYRKNH